MYAFKGLNLKNNRVNNNRINVDCLAIVNHRLVDSLAAWVVLCPLTVVVFLVPF